MTIPNIENVLDDDAFEIVNQMIDEVNALSLSIETVDVDRGFDEDRPGDTPLLFTTTVTGPPSGAVGYTGGTIQSISDLGRVLRVSGPVTLGSLKRHYLYAETWRLYCIVRRAAVSGDPFGDGVEIGVRWLDASFATAGNTIAHTANPGVGSTVTHTKTFGPAVADGVEVVWPATAKYAVPYVKIYGSNNLTDIATIRFEPLIEVPTSEQLAQLADAVADAEAAAADVVALQSDIDNVESMVDFLTLSGLTSQKHVYAVSKPDGTDWLLRGVPHYSLYDYGAVGNGVADDTAAWVACKAAADANDGFQASPKGRGVIVVPPGFFAIDGAVLDNNYGKVLGLGGRLQSRAANTDILTVSASSCIVRDLIIYDPFLPTANCSPFTHDGGADCLFENIEIIGGLYGAKAIGGGDSVWRKIKIHDCYSDFLYMEGYQGLWGDRLKLDFRWMVQNPVAANDKGNWATNTAYVVGDVVICDGGIGPWVFQCIDPGTSAASGLGPLPAAFGVDIVDNGVVWRTQMRANRAACHMESDCFINTFHNCDFTGGHWAGLRTSHTVGTYAPQSIYVSGGTEFGHPFKYGGWFQAAQHVNIQDTFVDSGIAADSTGIVCDVVRDIKMRGLTIHTGFRDGLLGNANTKHLSLMGSDIMGCSRTAFRAEAGMTDFDVSHNNLGGDASLWGVNGIGAQVVAGASDHYVISGNRTRGAVTLGISDGGTGTNKYVGNNIS